MAEHLGRACEALEDKVRGKTQRLEVKRERLSALDEASGVVSRATSVEQPSQGFCAMIRRIARADAPVRVIPIRPEAGRALPYCEPAGFRTLVSVPLRSQHRLLGGVDPFDVGGAEPGLDDRSLFGRDEVGVLPRLVHSRFGLHVVEVLARERGTVPSFESVREAVAQSLRQQAFVDALRQHLAVLAGRATLEGVALERTETPLVQ